MLDPIPYWSELLLEWNVVPKAKMAEPGTSGRRSPLTINREEIASTYSSFFLESTVMAE